MFFLRVFPQTVCPHYGVLTVGGPSATAAFDCAGSHRVPFASTVCGRSARAGFWVVLLGVRVLFGAKRGFT